MTTDFQARREAALLQRIDELMQAPPLVYLLDHYLDALSKTRAGDSNAPHC